MSCRGMREEHLPAGKKAHIDNYLAALLSGPCLELASIKLTSLKLSLFIRESRIHPQDKLYHIGRILAPVCCPRLTTLCLSTLALRQIELEGFLRGLGGRLKRVDLYSVALLGGGWERPLDLLREKILGGRSPEECSVSLDYLRGGGFDSVKGNDTDNYIDVFAAIDKLKLYWDGCGGNLLHQQAEKYVSGAKGMVNPLAELEADLRD